MFSIYDHYNKKVNEKDYSDLESLLLDIEDIKEKALSTADRYSLFKIIEREESGESRLVQFFRAERAVNGNLFWIEGSISELTSAFDIVRTTITNDNTIYDVNEYKMLGRMVEGKSTLLVTEENKLLSIPTREFFKTFNSHIIDDSFFIRKTAHLDTTLEQLWELRSSYANFIVDKLSEFLIGLSDNPRYLEKSILNLYGKPLNQKNFYNKFSEKYNDLKSIGVIFRLHINYPARKLYVEPYFINGLREYGQFNHLKSVNFNQTNSSYERTFTISPEESKKGYKENILDFYDYQCLTGVLSIYIFGESVGKEKYLPKTFANLQERLIQVLTPVLQNLKKEADILSKGFSYSFVQTNSLDILV